MTKDSILQFWKTLSTNGLPLEKVAAKLPEFSPLGETKIRKQKVQLPQNQPFFLAAVSIWRNKTSVEFRQQRVLLFQFNYAFRYSKKKSAQRK